MAKKAGQKSGTLNSISGQNNTFIKGVQQQKIAAGRIAAAERDAKIYDLQQAYDDLQNQVDNKAKTTADIADRVKSNASAITSPFSIENLTFTTVQAGDDRKSKEKADKVNDKNIQLFEELNKSVKEIALNSKQIKDQNTDISKKIKGDATDSKVAKIIGKAKLTKGDKPDGPSLFDKAYNFLADNWLAFFAASAIGKGLIGFGKYMLSSPKKISKLLGFDVKGGKAVPVPSPDKPGATSTGDKSNKPMTKQERMEANKLKKKGGGGFMVPKKSPTVPALFAKAIGPGAVALAPVSRVGMLGLLANPIVLGGIAATTIGYLVGKTLGYSGEDMLKKGKDLAGGVFSWVYDNGKKIVEWFQKMQFGTMFSNLTSGWENIYKLPSSAGLLGGIMTVIRLSPLGTIINVGSATIDWLFNDAVPLLKDTYAWWSTFFEGKRDNRRAEEKRKKEARKAGLQGYKNKNEKNANARPEAEKIAAKYRSRYNRAMARIKNAGLSGNYDKIKAANLDMLKIKDEAKKEFIAIGYTGTLDDFLLKSSNVKNTEGYRLSDAYKGIKQFTDSSETKLTDAWFDEGKKTQKRLDKLSDIKWNNGLTEAQNKEYVHLLIKHNHFFGTDYSNKFFSKANAQALITKAQNFGNKALEKSKQVQNILTSAKTAEELGTAIRNLATGGFDKPVFKDSFNGGTGSVSVTKHNGKLAVVYPNGKMKVGGHKNWRHNNPGNISAGNRTTLMYNAIGIARYSTAGISVADNNQYVFSSMAAGTKAWDELVKANYSKGSIANEFIKYQESTQGYYAKMDAAKAAGININSNIQNLTPKQYIIFRNIIFRFEGFKVGQVISIGGVSKTPNAVAAATPSVSATTGTTSLFGGTFGAITSEPELGGGKASVGPTKASAGTGLLKLESQVTLQGCHPETLDALKKLAYAWNALGNGSLTLNSAYRSPDYNTSVGGATNSMHVKGRAFDIRWGHWPQKVRELFLKMAGEHGFMGFGIYQSFVHIDTGGMRAWGDNGSRSSLPSWAAVAIGIAHSNIGTTNSVSSMPTISNPTGQTIINGVPVMTSRGSTMAVVNNTLKTLQTEIFNMRESILTKEQKQLKKEGKDGLYGILPVPACTH